MCKNTFCPLHAHSYYSLLDGLSSPQDIVCRCKELDLPAVALTDHGSIAGLVSFHNAGKKYGIKTISGSELYICEQDPSIKTNENNKRYHLTILAKNNDGLNDLTKLISECNRPDYFYRKPRISLDKLKDFTAKKNLLCLSGCLASELSSKLFTDVNKACKMSLSIDDIKKMLLPNWKEIGFSIIEKYQKIFGKDNYFIEIQDEEMPVQKVVIECLRFLADQAGIERVATQDSHYTKKEDSEDQRILLYSQMGTTQEEQEKLRETDGDTMAFFHLDTFYIYGQDDAEQKYTQKEIENTLMIADMCSVPKIGRHPLIPKYNDNSNDTLRSLCIDGAKNKLSKFDTKTKKIYWDRLQRELFIIKEAKLADYFLIVWDACKYIDDNKAPRGKGRGSGAGSLVNYLLNITKIDPIEYDLYFERFYNASRNIPAHFDISNLSFMSWYENNFDNLHTINSLEDRDTVLKTIRNNIKVGKYHKFNDDIKKEIDWINSNNLRMWSYILCCLKSKSANSISENKFNSRMSFILHLGCQHNDEQPFSFISEHISLPDIDSDLGVAFRDKLINYLINKWGSNNVSQMITFGRLQGKAALKEVFRAQPETVKQLMKVKALKSGEDPNTLNIRPIDVVNDITKHIPDEAYIADELQQIREETGDEEYGILQWSIDHIPEVKNAYQWYKPLFDQAIRIEGTKKNASKHAAGVIITSEPIENIAPLTYDTKSKNRICGVEMSVAEKMGLVKFDWLGVVALDKLQFAQEMINGVR